MRQEVRGQACPCCGHPVHVPSLEMVIELYRVTEFQSRILRPLWKAAGRTVSTQRIFDEMYADDPDGGPSNTEMYKAFKFGLHRLRARLEGSGIEIENVGYRRGWRLVMKGSE